MTGFILLIIGAVIYFIPSMVGWNHRNSNSILALNLFLGWTILGWVGALVWALSKDKNEQNSPTNVYQKSTTTPEFTGIAKELENIKWLNEKGILSDEEYRIAKDKILRS